MEPKALEDLKVKLFDKKGQRHASPNRLENDFEIVDFPETPVRRSKTRKSILRKSASSNSRKKLDRSFDPMFSGRSSHRKIITLNRLRTKPGKIFNSNLVYFDDDSNLRFNEDILEGKDYFLIDSKTWNYFKKWYG